MEDVLGSPPQETQQGTVTTLLVFPNEEERHRAKDILLSKNLDANVFAVPDAFSGINLAAIQFPSGSLDNIYEALQGHGIVVGGACPYHRPKALGPEKRLSIPGEPCETSGTYLKSIAVTRVLPCLGEVAMIRVTAQTSIDVADIMPYLNTQMPRATYIHEAKTLTFTDERRIITIYPTKIEMAKIEGMEDALRVLSRIRDTVNDTYRNRCHIQPTNEKRIKLGFLELYGYLPKTNCRQCGELTCLAFGAKVLREEQKIAGCRVLLLPEFHQRATHVFGILEAMGYEVPIIEGTNESDS